MPHPVWLFNNHKQQSVVFDYRILTGSLNYYFLHYGFHQWAFASQSHHYFKNNVFYDHALNDALITYVIGWHDWLIEINQLLIIMISGWNFFWVCLSSFMGRRWLIVNSSVQRLNKFDFQTWLDHACMCCRPYHLSALLELTVSNTSCLQPWVIVVIL